jgi:hypothetical protein
MRKLITLMAVLAACLVLAPAAMAAGNNKNGPTVGDCISDGFYGNEPNTVNPEVPGAGPSEVAPGTKDGRVVPSQSPGPKKTEKDGTVVPGSSVGDIHQQFGPGIVPKVCRALTA